MQNNDTSLRVDETSISSYTFKIQNYSKYMRIFLPTKTFVIVQLHERRCSTADSQVQHSILRCMQNNEQRVNQTAISMHSQRCNNKIQVPIYATKHLARKEYKNAIYHKNFDSPLDIHLRKFKDPSGLQLPPPSPRSQAEQKPAFSHSSQRLCS
ncbi:hypothetical protein P8452_55821 [Trifolium repens]|nr:hypothetical protein P8452_55821 [Trifolium repens]